MSAKNIKFMPDYGCWPLWDMDDFGDIAPNKLPISKSLQQRIESWTEKFDDTLDIDNPICSGFKTEYEERMFAEEGWLIFKELRKQLPKAHIFIKGFVFEKFPDLNEFKERK